MRPEINRHGLTGGDPQTMRVSSVENSYSNYNEDKLVMQDSCPKGISHPLGRFSVLRAAVPTHLHHSALLLLEVILQLDGQAHRAVDDNNNDLHEHRHDEVDWPRSGERAELGQAIVRR